MRIKTIKISGFKAIPFCATVTGGDQRGVPVRIQWASNAFQLTLPTQRPLLSTIIGPNSCGKSCVLYALSFFFGSATKIPVDLFNCRQTNGEPVTVEITFWGQIPNVEEWHRNNCIRVDDHYELTITNIWTTEGRATYIRCTDGTYSKAGTKDKESFNPLLPQYRLIAADQKLSDEANPEKKNLVTDLVKEVLELGQNASRLSIINKIRRQLAELTHLLDRASPPNAVAWREIENLEKMMSEALEPITPGGPQVRLSVKDSVPTLENIFLKSRMRIDDGIELDIDNHGLGLQRSFIVSALSAWCQLIGHKQDNVDYLFAIEEPELYLHPHAIRVFLKTFEEIAEVDQIIFTSHSGEFVNHVPLENVIRIQRTRNQRSIIQTNLLVLSHQEKVKIQRYLLEDRSDMLFARSVILVEGQSELFSLPCFAQKIKYDFDKSGVSVVFVNGKGNFPTYHQILQAFGIPHIIFADGDGDRAGKENLYRTMADHVFVLENDFEHLVASTFTEDRLLEVINECRRRRGENEINALSETNLKPEGIASHWWDSLIDHINADIANEHRQHYDIRKQELRDLHLDTARSIVASDHLHPSTAYKRLAARLKREGKPLVGRVLGDMATSEEVRGMLIISTVIQRAVELAG